MKRLLVRLIAFLGVFILGLYFIGVDILNFNLAPSLSRSQFWSRQLLVSTKEQASTIAASAWARWRRSPCRPRE